MLPVLNKKAVEQAQKQLGVVNTAAKNAAAQAAQSAAAVAALQAANKALQAAHKVQEQALKKAQKDGELPEDDSRRLVDQVQKLHDTYVAQVEEVLKRKEAEVMEV